MRSFQAGNVTAIRSERVVCTVKVREKRFKIFQVFFGRDGSLFINFPYFRHRTGLLAAATIPANGSTTSQVSLELGGKVASHLVKYSHHPDGRAHFSQDGKVFTAIKRMSIPLNVQDGHICSLVLQGHEAFELAHPTKDNGVSPQRSVVDFGLEEFQAIKFVGRWYDVNRMRFSTPVETIGPILETVDPDGTHQQACLVASPQSDARHVLALTCSSIPRLGPEPEVMVFYGGFDPRERMDNTLSEAGFLAFIYPASNPDELRQRIGTSDYARERT